jgi:hypothetical protein
MSRQPRRLARIGASADLSNMAAVLAYVGPSGELIADGKTLRVQDGVKPGGIPLQVSGSVTLLASASATGAGQAWPGGTGIWSVSGTWGGATAQLQGSADSGGTWTDVTGASTGVNTTSGQFIGDFPGSYIYRVALSGASGTTSLTSTLRTLDQA